jgi:hypothetical protein
MLGSGVGGTDQRGDCARIAWVSAVCVKSDKSFLSNEA